MLTKRRVLELVSCLILILATACTPPGQRPEADTDQSLYRERANDRPHPYDYVHETPPGGPRVGGGQNQIGYIRYRAAQYRRDHGGRVPPPDVYVDRNALARQIAYLVTTLPGIDDATVLATDDHVFVGINDTKGKKMDAATVRRARQTALAVTPRYYRVHIVSEEALIRRMNEVGTQLKDRVRVEGSRGNLQQLLRDLGDTTPPDVGAPGVTHKRSRPGINETSD